MQANKRVQRGREASLSSYEIPFYLKKGQKPDVIELNLVVEGIGKVGSRTLSCSEHR